MRRLIRQTIAELEGTGLLVVEHRGGKSDPALYRLTYLRSKCVPAVGAPYYVEPTNDWQKYEPIPSKPKAKPNGRMNGSHVPPAAWRAAVRVSRSSL